MVIELLPALIAAIRAAAMANDNSSALVFAERMPGWQAPQSSTRA
jgi:hypothetical protein